MHSHILAGRSVLIVEDEPHNALDTMKVFECAGAQVKVARTRADARMKRVRLSAVALALITLVIPAEASAEPFGACAHQRNLDMKIASCIEASRATSNPSILQWVYSTLARAQH